MKNISSKNFKNVEIDIEKMWELDIIKDSLFHYNYTTLSWNKIIKFPSEDHSHFAFKIESECEFSKEILWSSTNNYLKALAAPLVKIIKRWE